MIEQGFAVARYRIRTTFRRRWTGLPLPGPPDRPGRWTRPRQPGRGAADAVVVLDVPRRHQSVGSAGVDLQRVVRRGNLDYRLHASGGHRPASRRPPRGTPGFVVTGAPLTPDGSPRIRVTGLAYPVASVNGLFFTQDRMAVSEGHLASPHGPTRSSWRRWWPSFLGFHVGQVIPFGFYSDAQQNLPRFRHQGRAPAVAREHEARRTGVAELGDRRGRRRHPSHFPPADARRSPRSVLAHKGESFAGR